MNRAVLRTKDREVTVNAISLHGEDAVALLWELHQRLKERDSTVFREGEKAMMIQQLEKKIGDFFDKLNGQHTGLYSKVILASKGFVIDNLEKLQVHVKDFFDNGSFNHSVDALFMLLKGNVKVSLPWYLKLAGYSTDKILDELANWLKLNSTMFKEGIGSANPMAVTN